MLLGAIVERLGEGEEACRREYNQLVDKDKHPWDLATNASLDEEVAGRVAEVEAEAGVAAEEVEVLRRYCWKETCVCEERV